MYNFIKFITLFLLFDTYVGNFSFTGIPTGIKPPPSHIAVPSPYGLSKPVGRNVSPVHQSSHSSTVFSPYGNNINQAINATRTSSFAAALRKLAKAVEPGTGNYFFYSLF